MDQYFDSFIEKLGLAEEKLNILSEWHLVQKQHGATEIAEDCRCAISALWLEFYGLVEEYNREKEHHETIKQFNIDYLFSELKTIEGYIKDGHAPERLKSSYFFELLEKVALEYTDPYKRFAMIGTEEDKSWLKRLTLWQYLRDLVEKDLATQPIKQLEAANDN